MKTVNTRQLLKDFARGKTAFSALQTTDANIDHKYELYSTLELEWTVQMCKLYGNSPNAWPKQDQEYSAWIAADVPQRIKTDYFDTVSFWYNGHYGELYPICYKDKTKKWLYQIEVGEDREQHPNVIYTQKQQYKRFVHLNLNDWEAEIDFTKLIKPELPRMVGVLHKDVQGIPRDESDQQVITELCNETQLRQNVETKWRQKIGDYYIIHYLNGTTKAFDWENKIILDEEN